MTVETTSPRPAPSAYPEETTHQESPAASCQRVPGKMRRLREEIKAALDPTLRDDLIDVANAFETDKEPVWKNWGIPPEEFIHEGKRNYSRHSQRLFGFDFTEQCLLDETEHVRKEIDYSGRVNLFTLVEELRRKENFSCQQCIDNETPITFAHKGLDPQQQGMIQVQHDPKAFGKRDVRTLFFLLARTFGKELADALYRRYGFMEKSHITLLDVKNILAGVDANVKFSDLKRLFDHLHRANRFSQLSAQLPQEIQEKLLAGNPVLTSDEWHTIRGHAAAFGWAEMEETTLLAGLTHTEPLLACRELLLPEDTQTLLQKNRFDDLNREDISLLLRAFRSIRRVDEKNVPFFASYAQWLFQNEKPKFFGRETFDTIHHDREMAQAFSRIEAEILFDKASPSERQRRDLSSAMAEKISREYIYFETRMGHVIPYIERTGAVSTISVIDEVSQNGLHAKLFAPVYAQEHYSKENPLPIHIAFRGTQWDHYIAGSLESIRRDVDFTGIGRRSFLSCWNSLRDMLVNYLRTTPTPSVDLHVNGHSLGGVDAERMTLAVLTEYNRAFANVNYPHRKQWLKLGKIHLETFNSPKANIGVARDWQYAQSRLEASGAPLHIAIKYNLLRYKTKKGVHADLAQKFGEAHLGFDAPTSPQVQREVTLHTLPKPLSALELHNAEVYSASSCKTPIERQSYTEEKEPERLERLLGGSYYTPPCKNRRQRFLYNVKTIAGKTTIPFVVISKIALEVLIRLWVSVKRIRFEQKRYEFQAGPIMRLLRGLRLRKGSNLRIHPSYFY